MKSNLFVTSFKIVPGGDGMVQVAATDTSPERIENFSVLREAQQKVEAHLKEMFDKGELRITVFKAKPNGDYREFDYYIVVNQALTGPDAGYERPVYYATIDGPLSYTKGFNDDPAPHMEAIIRSMASNVAKILMMSMNGLDQLIKSQGFYEAQRAMQCKIIKNSKKG